MAVIKVRGLCGTELSARVKGIDWILHRKQVFKDCTIIHGVSPTVEGYLTIPESSLDQGVCCPAQ